MGNMVEWKKLGDICDIIRGNGVQKTDFVEKGVGCIHYGQIYTHYGPFTYTTNKFVSKEVFEKARKASKGDIIMTDTSENVEDICKSVAYLGEEDIAVSNHALILKHKQNPKFLTYSTLTDSFLIQKKKYVVGAKVSSIKPEYLAQIKIYLPSLSEQTRIVGILDTFTASIENLKQQIAERRKQYEHYRDQLLDLEGKEGVEMKTLGEVCVIKGEYGLSVPSKPFDGVRYIRITDITDSGTLNNDCVSADCDEVEKEPLKDGDILFARTGATVGKTLIYLNEYGECLYAGYLIRYRIKHGIVLPKYVFHFTHSNQYNMWVKSNLVEGAQPNINAQKYNSLGIPIPSLEEQSRIVSILDTFEASIANLEAQLKEREKQYEYYRNKLLTFE